MRSIHPARVLLATAVFALLAPTGARAQAGPSRVAFGAALQGLKPQGEFAENVNFAGGLAGNVVYALDEAGIIALRADVGFLIYGSERYRVPLGGGPLGLINVDVNTTNSIFHGGVGLQLLAPGPTVRPYANATAGFSYFSTGSSVSGSQQDTPFASSTNYSDLGFAWTAGGGLYVPLRAGSTRIQLDLGATWMDNGSREYLRSDGITFEAGGVQLNPVRSQAQALRFHLGIMVPLG
jgi:hypothetical protein